MAAELRNERMCLSKRVFPTRQDACQFAASQRERFQRRQRAYRCPNCKWWHLSSKAKMRRARRKTFSRRTATHERMAELMTYQFVKRGGVPYQNQLRARRLLLRWWTKALLKTPHSATKPNEERRTS